MGKVRLKVVTVPAQDPVTSLVHTAYNVTAINADGSEQRANGWTLRDAIEAFCEWSHVDRSQIVLKRPKAFEKIEYGSYSPVERHIYFPRRKLRDEEARAAYRAELEREVSTGLFMRDIIREEVKPDDPRLQ